MAVANKNEFQQKIAQFMEASKLSDMMRQNAREMGQRFSIPAFSEAVESVYQEQMRIFSENGASSRTVSLQILKPVSGYTLPKTNRSYFIFCLTLLKSLFMDSD